MFFQRVFAATASADLQETYSLIDAAHSAHQHAVRETWPLAHVAERSGRSHYWFAKNILQVVNVCGLRAGEAEHVVLTRDLTAGLELSDDMTVLIDPNDNQAKFGELRVSKSEFERYLAWARTVY